MTDDFWLAVGDGDGVVTRQPTELTLLIRVK
jgi:hypothetical protein